MFKGRLSLYKPRLLTRVPTVPHSGAGSRSTIGGAPQASLGPASVSSSGGPCQRCDDVSFDGKCSAHGADGRRRWLYCIWGSVGRIHDFMTPAFSQRKPRLLRVRDSRCRQGGRRKTGYRCAKVTGLRSMTDLGALPRLLMLSAPPSSRVKVRASRSGSSAPARRARSATVASSSLSSTHSQTKPEIRPPPPHYTPARRAPRGRAVAHRRSDPQRAPLPRFHAQPLCPPQRP